ATLRGGSVRRIFPGMEQLEQRAIDLEPAAFREVPNKPLTDPKVCRRAMWAGGVGTVVCALGAWQIGGPWAAFLPAFPAAIFGAAWLALAPGFWLRENGKG